MTNEPQIDILGRAARIGLRILRWVSILAGIVAIVGAIYIVIDPVPVYSENIPPTQTVIAHQMAFVCLGLPWVLPIACTFGRGKWIALGIGAALWFGPMALAGDHSFGFLIRMFASFVALAVLGVWRTLYGLSNPMNAVSPAPAEPRQ